MSAAVLVREAPRSFRRRRVSDQAASLDALLAELGIEPFSATSVRRYKRSQAWKASSFLPGLPGRLLVPFAKWGGVILFFGGLIVFGICFLWDVLALSPYVKTYIWVHWGMALGFALVIGAGALMFEVGGRYYHWAAWRRYDLKTYQKEGHLPRQVVGLIRQIKARNPDIRFKVEVLEQDQVPIDPLLRAEYKGRKRYVAMWNEEGYVDV